MYDVGFVFFVECSVFLKENSYAVYLVSLLAKRRHYCSR